jgi:hypothetical protein
MANINIGYGTAVIPAVTGGLASLASDTNLLAGWQSDILDNSSTLAVDILVSGKIRVGTTPSINTNIYVYAWAQLDPTPIRPDSFGTTAATRSITSDGASSNFLKLVAGLNVDATTTDRDYWFGPVSLAQVFGGTIPVKWGLWVVHNTGVALNSTAANQTLYYTPVIYTVA